MAHRLATIEPAVEGETRFGASRARTQGIQGVLYVPSTPTPLLGSVLALDGVDSNGDATTWYLFVTAAGELRIANALPTDTETDGSAV